jgi:hypothetical protein
VTTVVYLKNEQQAALDAARHLAASGVPLFVAKPALDAQSLWVPDGGTNGTGYTFPKSWQNSVADPRVVDRWRAGDALCAVMGHLVDGADFDPRHGGDRSLEHLKATGALPKVYGTQSTPSGGVHHLVASLGVRSRDGVLPGFDYKAGTDGGGRGFLFLAPTVKLSKVTGEPVEYTWEVPPDLDDLVLLGTDLTGGGLRALLEERTTVEYDGPTYVGRRYAELTDAEKAWADGDVEGVVDWWRSLLQEAESWDDAVRDERGRGWEALVRDWTWVCARMAVTPWIGLDVDEAEALCRDAIPEAVAAAVGNKWDQDLMARASARAVEPPPWDGLGALRDQERVDVTNPAVAAEWLRNEIGMVGTPLAGLFRRGEEIVHTPRIDEDGYVAVSRGERDLDGPAQVRVAGVDRVAARVQFSYSVVKRIASRKKVEGCLFPGEAVRMVLGDVQLSPNLRPLRGVTHTPMIRGDGSVLDSVGYDEATGRLFLPDPGLSVGEVPARPTAEDIAGARTLLLKMVADFPFNTIHDRANFLGLLLTPLMRELIPSPYKMGVMNAHQPGSGKSLLAWILRTIHGGVLRGDTPKDSEEFRKQITSILTTTTAPVVQFDNVRHLEATVLDAVLTSDTWSDRVLGATKEATARNDRLWVATGNNVTLGGDLVRRVLWVSIDPRLPNPEARTDFQIPDLKGWVRDHRGELLRALLILLRAWVVAGRPVGEKVGSDDFAGWIEGLRGVLTVAGIEGTVEESVTVQQKTTEEGDDMVAFFSAIWDNLGGDKWSASAVADMVFDDAPEGLNVTSARSLGRWLTKYEGRWAGDLCVRQDGFDSHGRAKMWRLERWSAQE